MAQNSSFFVTLLDDCMNWSLHLYNLSIMLFINLKNNSVMRLNKLERESFFENVSTFFCKNPQIKHLEVVDHFVEEGIARRTVYNA